MDNPYDVLDVSIDATKLQIVQAVKKAMLKKKYKPKEIAEAQKILMDPNKRIEVDFMRFFLVPIKKPSQKKFSDEELNAVEPEMKINHQFDRIDNLIQSLESHYERTFKKS